MRDDLVKAQKSLEGAYQGRLTNMAEIGDPESRPLSLCDTSKVSVLPHIFWCCRVLHLGPPSRRARAKSLRKYCSVYDSTPRVQLKLAKA